MGGEKWPKLAATVVVELGKMWVVCMCGWCVCVGGVYVWVVCMCGWCVCVGGVYVWVVCMCGWCVCVGGVYVWVVCMCMEGVVSKMSVCVGVCVQCLMSDYVWAINNVCGCGCLCAGKSVSDLCGCLCAGVMCVWV